MRSTKWALSSDNLAPGHGIQDPKTDVANHKSYAENSHCAVLAGLS